MYIYIYFSFIESTKDCKYCPANAVYIRTAIRRACVSDTMYYIVTISTYKYQCFNFSTYCVVC